MGRYFTPDTVSRDRRRNKMVNVKNFEDMLSYSFRQLHERDARTDGHRTTA